MSSEQNQSQDLPLRQNGGERKYRRRNQSDRSRNAPPVLQSDPLHQPVAEKTSVQVRAARNHVRKKRKNNPASLNPRPFTRKV